MTTPTLVLAGDVGGTNARLQLWAIPAADPDAARCVAAATLSPPAFPTLAALLAAFFAEHAGGSGLPDHTVLAICGPVWEGNRRNDSNNTSWREHCADDVEDALGLRRGSLLFINDFEANGYALAAHHAAAGGGQRTPPCCALRPPPEVLFVGDKAEGGVVACVGAGTGLGACFLTPSLPVPGTTNGGDASAPTEYTVCPSEAGMTEALCPRDETEWRLLQWLRARHGVSYLEVERIVSGPGLADVARYLVQTNSDECEGDAALRQVLSEKEGGTASAAVAQHAEAGNATALRAVDTFLSFYGRALGSAAMTFMCYSGLYIAGGILPKLRWRWAGAGAAARTGGSANPLVDAYVDQGPTMTPTVRRIPMLLVEDGDAGIKGALFVALRRLQQAQ